MNEHKTVLILDNVDRGTIQTSLQTNNYFRIHKLLNSSVKNWISMCKILEKDVDNEIVVIAKFTEHTLFKMCSPDYVETTKSLIGLIQRKKHLIYIYKDNLFGRFSYFDKLREISLDFDEINNPENYSRINLKTWLALERIKIDDTTYLQTVREFIRNLNGSSLNILPYEKLIDIENSGQVFIENIVEGLLFRIYVPKERIWSQEFDKFITLFRDYASIVSNKELKITQNRTDLGVICSLYSLGNSIKEDKINDLYKEFTAFMDLCANNPNEAQRIIENLPLGDSKKSQIFQKYIKESQRLLLDLRHEKEIKYISIKHRLESELQEYSLNNEILKYIENSLPNSESTKSIVGGFQQVIHNQTININPQIISKVDGIVCSELNGNISFSQEEKEIEKLIEKYVSEFSESTKLKSALYELKDTASTQDKKRGAWQQLYGFLGKVGDKIGDVGVSLLTKYIEQQMNA